ncbi:MAG: hypothetical protein WCZ23_16645 [Rhodospirillaceae bacterium]
MLVKKDMSLTPAEFRNGLPAALRGLDWQVGADDTVTVDDGAVLIRCVVQPPRRLTALLSLPRCLVTLELGGLPEADRAGFLARFDRAFQRGGG